MFEKARMLRDQGGTEVCYLQLTHKEWDAETARTKVGYSFGRAGLPGTDPALG